MFFSQIISEITKKHPVRVVCVSDIYDIRDIALLDGQQSEFANHTVYFGYSKQLRRDKVPAQCILASEDLLAPAVNCGDLALAEPQALFAVFNLAKRLVEAHTRQSLYAELTEKADETRDLDMVLNAASMKLGNSLIFSDINFKIISYSTSIPVTDFLWKEHIERGFCSYEFISAVRQLESVRKAAYTTDAVEVTCSESPYRKFSSKVFLKGNQVGFVLMIEGETTVTPSHIEAMSDISRAVSYTVAHYQPYLIQSGGRHQQLLYDLLIGTPPEALTIHLSSLRFPPRMAALSLRPTRYLGVRHLREHVGPAILEALPNSHFTFHEDGIAVLLSLGNGADLSSEQLKTLETFAAAEHVRIGVANGFSSIQHFARGYAQARSALTLGERLDREQPVYRYLDYQFYDLLAQVPKGTHLGLYCHPALTLLRQYDSRGDGALYHTLRVYLECGCSIKEAADALFIHRNSLAYRLDRIAEIGQVDLESPSTRFLLRVSYRIDHYLGHDG